MADRQKLETEDIAIEYLYLVISCFLFNITNVLLRLYETTPVQVYLLKVRIFVITLWRRHKKIEMNKPRSVEVKSDQTHRPNSETEQDESLRSLDLILLLSSKEACRTSQATRLEIRDTYYMHAQMCSSVHIFICLPIMCHVYAHIHTRESHLITFPSGIQSYWHAQVWPSPQSALSLHVAASPTSPVSPPPPPPLTSSWNLELQCTVRSTKSAK